MDSKRLKFDDKDTLKDIETFSSFPIVGDAPTKVYLYVKSQRLSVALHILTNHIKDIEPAKFEVRKNAIAIVNLVSKLNRTQQRDRQDVIGSIGEIVLSTIAVIETLMHVGLVSSESESVIKRELVFLVRLADGHIFNTENEGYLDPEILNIPSVHEHFGTKRTSNELEKKHVKKVLAVESSVNNQGEQFIEDKSKKDSSGYVDKKEAKAQGDSIGHIGQSISDNRISSIISLLKIRSGLSVKDFTEVIPGVSEKTIQRELVVLSNKGIINKMGERRWTRYSLAP